MSIGSILVGVALVLGIGAYLARPFRQGRVDLDQAIEIWASQVRASGAGEDVEEAVNHCAQCGRRAGPDDRFCAGCGRPLSEGVE